MLGYVALLAVTSWRIDELALVTANRLLLHLLIPAICVLALAWRSEESPLTR